MSDTAAALNADGTLATDPTFARLDYALTDRNFSVIGTGFTSGEVGDRVRYDPYGTFQAFPAGDVNRDGAVNSGDTTAIMFASGYQADLDVNMDGAVDSKDSGVVSKLRGRSLGAGELSDRGNIVGWCGYLYEEATGMWLARHRWQIPELGRWANRDPIGYAGGGQNLYEYVNGNPVFLQDSMGLSDENPDYDNIAHLRAYEDEETGQRMQASPCWSSLRGILEDQRDGESMEDCAKRVEGSKANFKRWECQKELAEDAPGIPWNDLLTDPHVVLGVLGMTPGFGIAADLVDAGLYLSEGKFAEAGWSLVAAVPFVGDAIAAGRLGSRVSKVVKATGNAVNRAVPPPFVKLTFTAAKASKTAVRAGAKYAVKAVKKLIPTRILGAFGGVNLMLKYKPGWSELQRAEAAAKVQALNDATTVVSRVQRQGTSASRMWQRAGGSVPRNYEVDHIVDLQLGGSDTLANMWLLNYSVNRSLGAQIYWQIKDLPIGTRINRVRIRD